MCPSESQQETNFRQNLAAAFQGRQLRATIILLTSTLLMFTWKYFGTAEFYHEHLSAHFVLGQDAMATGALYHYFSLFCLLGVVPALIVKLVFREKLAQYGVRLGNVKRSLLLFALLGPVMVLVGYLASSNLEMIEEYPKNKNAAANFGWHAFTYIWFYLGWEFHFRGYLQHGLLETMGRTNTILVQTMASTLLHIGTPTLETFGAIGGGILWGIVAFRTRSLLSGWLQHCTLGVTVDWCTAFLR